jgi:hypothetical protein
MAGWQFRPAKHMQRLMAVDVMRRLSAFRPLHEYRYVGLGGYEFVDFDLVRRALGIHLMTSIESSGKTERYVFNRPFPDIELKFGTSNDMLPEVALDEPLIVWMDYCASVRDDVLRDVLLLGQQLLAGSMLIVTVNASVAEDGQRLKTLEHNVTKERVPMGIDSEHHLDGSRTADVQRRVLAAEMRQAMSARAARFEQVFNIHYRDTQRMQTWGGVVVDAGSESRFQAADFRSLPQVRTGADALSIKVPVLTAREVLRLEEQLVTGAPAPTLPWLKATESESFADLHRWYPPVPAPM